MWPNFSKDEVSWDCRRIDPKGRSEEMQIAVLNLKVQTVIKLGSITTKVGSGATPRGGKEVYKTEGISLIRSLNVYDFSFDSKGLAFIDDNQACELSNVEVQPKDILLNITGASVARCTMVPDVILPARVNQHVAIIRINPSLADPHYVLYCLNSPRYKQRLLTLAQGGATREALTKETLTNFELALPLLAVQTRIGSILSAYDALIEKNKRRIKILEEMAQALYSEWFVHFRFPGHEKITLVESVLGRIPQGWRVGRLDDALVLQRGFDLPTKEREPGNIPIYASNGWVGNHSTFRTKGPGIVTGRSGSLGTVIYIHEDFWPLNTTLWVREFRAVSPLYSFYLLRNLELGSFNSGAAVPTLNRNNIHGLPVIIPPRPMLLRFDALVQPLFDLKRNLTAKNKSLSATRDLLLPKLISGEVDSSNGASSKRN